MKNFEVTMDVEARNEDEAYEMVSVVERKYGDSVFVRRIRDEDERRYEVRISYEEDWHGEGEHFVFEGKWSDEEEWGLDTAFKLLDFRNEKGFPIEQNVLLNYQALTKIRELIRSGIYFYFS